MNLDSPDLADARLAPEREQAFICNLQVSHWVFVLSRRESCSYDGKHNSAERDFRVDTVDWYKVLRQI